MRILDNIIEGLEIVRKYYPQSEITADNDQIWVGHEDTMTTKTKITPTDMDRLYTLGWELDKGIGWTYVFSF